MSFVAERDEYLAQRAQYRFPVFGGRVNRGAQALRADLVSADQGDDVGEVAFSGRRVSTVDHRHDLLGEDGLDRIAEQGERFSEQARVCEFDRRRRHRISNVDVDAKHLAGSMDARGHHDANPRIRIDIADGLRLHSTDVVFDSVVDRHREYIAYEIAHGVDVVVDRLCE